MENVVKRIIHTFFFIHGNIMILHTMAIEELAKEMNVKQGSRTIWKNITK